MKAVVGWVRNYSLPRMFSRNFQYQPTGEVCLDVAMLWAIDEQRTPGAMRESGDGELFSSAMNVQRDAAEVGFDWPRVDGVIAKLREETAECESAIAEGDVEGARRELGDLLFTVVNLARFVGADPGAELIGARDRFSGRFARVLEELGREGRRPDGCTLEELDAVWERVKLQG